MNKENASGGESSPEADKNPPQITPPAHRSPIPPDDGRVAQWFEIGLSHVAIAGLVAVRKTIYHEPQLTRNPAAMRIFFLSCLAHQEVITPIVLNDAEYCRIEGIEDYDSYFHGIIKEVVMRKLRQ